MNYNPNAYNPKAIAAVVLILAGAAAWGGFRELPKQENYEKVTGNVVSTTAVTKQGADKFTVKVWLEAGNEVAYRLAAYVSGSALGRNELVNGSPVEMLANKSEIAKPFKGFLGNVEPTIEIASLSANGKPISTWEDHIKYETEQRKMMKWGALGVLGIGIFISITRKMANKKLAS